MVAVSYERARGIRAMNQKCDGEFSVSVTRVMTVPLPQTLRRRDGRARNLVSQRRLRGNLPHQGQILARQMENRPAGNRLLRQGRRARRRSRCNPTNCPMQEAVEKERALWKKAIDKLQEIVEV